MKTIVVLVALGIVGWLAWQRLASQNPSTITDPVYAEFRVDATIEGRDLNMALFGEMASEDDCNERAQRVWAKVIEDCQACVMSLAACKPELEPRYQRLFDEQAIHSTYLSFTRGSRYERNGRLVVYGLTVEEGDAVCDVLAVEFRKKYDGEVRCVRARQN
jgi:hypothetical protein